MSGGGPPSPRVAKAGRHAGTTPGKRRRGPGVAKGRGPSARPREPRRGQRRECGVPGPGEQSAPLRGASTALPPLYGLGSRLQRRARHGCARRLRSPAGRADLGSPEAAFYPPSKADGDRDGKAGLRTGAPGPLAQPPGAGGDARGGRAASPSPGRRTRLGPCAGGNAQLPGSGGPRNTPAPPGPPAAPERHAQGSSASLQPIWGGPKNFAGTSQRRHR